MPSPKKRLISLSDVGHILEQAKSVEEVRNGLLDLASPQRVMDMVPPSPSATIYTELLKRHPPKPHRVRIEPKQTSPTRSRRTNRPAQHRTSPTKPQSKPKHPIPVNLLSPPPHISAPPPASPLRPAHPQPVHTSPPETEQVAGIDDGDWEARDPMSGVLVARDAAFVIESPPTPVKVTDNVMRHDDEIDEYVEIEAEPADEPEPETAAAYPNSVDMLTPTQSPAPPPAPEADDRLSPIPPTESSAWPTVDHRPAVSSPLSRLVFNVADLSDLDSGDDEPPPINSGWGFAVDPPLAVVEREGDGVTLHWTDASPPDTEAVKFGLSLVKQRLFLDDAGIVTPTGPPELLLDSSRQTVCHDPVKLQSGDVVVYVLVPMRCIAGLWEEGPASDAAVVSR